MQTHAQPQTVGRRYQLGGYLGSGSMGAVYRAADRLTGQTVALKRVTAPTERLAFTSRDLHSDPRVALAREFQMLASLRHPHIVEVLDYGFDEQQQPYFTMTLLEGARSIVRAGQGQPLAVQVNLLVQLLQALAYLHRRGVVHRDLKPANVLVVDGRVKVLDFGLALASTQTSEGPMVGTLAYAAPELFAGQQGGKGADLYAVGVIAYEVFAGRPPFDTTYIAALVNDILNTPADVWSIGVDEALAEVLERLLTKDRDERYADADETIAALCAATGCALPLETVEIRESFLQASRFVGRDAELAQLEAALQAAREGHGSAWLVGGESGVGKSRLLDELRIRALVQGATVLRGEGVAEGGLPYQLWRAPVRRLALTAELTDLEAGVLKEVVPDIGALLGREVPDAPALEGKARQQRLALTIADVFRWETTPVVLLLEDLHWAVESLEPLKHLNLIVGDLPLLIVGSYRDDERPDLPDELPGMHKLRLDRLDAESIAELSHSMLGEAGKRPQVVDLLQRETEGNVFFLVEVVRALAEEAGRLSDVGRDTLPAKVFAGGIEALVRRRLGRVPEAARALLKLAAVAGRALDLAVLQVIAPDVDLDRWVATCAGVAVLDVREGNWRFAHDKLREGVLRDLPGDERPALHRQVAEAIEAVYPDDEAQAAALVEHWHEAGDVDKEVHYARIAAEQALTVSDYPRMFELSERALPLLSGEDANALKAHLLNMLGRALFGLSEFHRAKEYFEESLAIARRFDDAANIVISLNGLGRVAASQGDYETAQVCHLEALTLARSSDDRRGIAGALGNLGIVSFEQGDYAIARDYSEQSLVIFRAIGHLEGSANSLNLLALITECQSDFAMAQYYHKESLAIRRTIGDQEGVAGSLNNLGIVAFRQGDTVVAQAYFEEGLAIFRAIGHQYGIAMSYDNLGITAYHTGAYEKAQANCEQGLAIRREIGDRRGIAESLGNLGLVSYGQGNHKAARVYLEEALAIQREIAVCLDIATTLYNLGSITRALGDYATAQACFTESQAIFRELNDRVGITQTLTGLAIVNLELEKIEEARQELREGLSLAQETGAIPSILEALLGFAQLCLVEGQPRSGAELVGLVASHPYLTVELTKTRLEPLCIDLEVNLTCDEFAAALERGKALDLDTVVTELLREFDNT